MRDKGKDQGVRLGSMILDHVFMSFGIIIGFGIIAMIIVGLTSLFVNMDISEEGLPTSIIILLIVLGLLFFSLYFNKDAIQGRSPAKRILKLVVINKRTGEVASPIRTFIRNITMMIWPIEVIFVLFSPDRRLGDLIAGTQVVEFKEEHKTAVNYQHLFMSIIIGVLFMLLLLALEFYLLGLDLNFFDL